MMNPLNWLQCRINPHKPDAYSHLHAIQTQPNQLLAQCLTDEALDEALIWLKDTAKEHDHSDVWPLSQHWPQRKAELQQRIQDGTFTFQTVRDVAIKNNEGRTEYREIRCAEDRLLLRAISQCLAPAFEQVIAPECTQLKGRGGTKAPVEDSYAQLLKQPDAHVMKSDVKGYYAHLQHVILHQQFCTLLPNETTLQHLLWLFLQRTVERGGNYRTVEKGIPLGSSLSPLLGALYLSPLDALFTQDDHHFYRRYMDDWVIFCKNRWDLRSTVKQVYAVLHTLSVEIAPDKTYIGKAHKGFDFLGKRIHPNGILPSASAVSRMQQKTIRLYEQGASKKRIGLYWVRWLCWAMAMATLQAHAATATWSPPTTITSASYDAAVTGDALGTTVSAGTFTTATGATVAPGADADGIYWPAGSARNSTVPAMASGAVISFSNPVVLASLTVGYAPGIGGACSSATISHASGATDTIGPLPAGTYLLPNLAGAAPSTTYTLTSSCSASSSFSQLKSINFTATATPVGTPPTTPGVFGGEKITPTRYQVIVSKVEFKNTQGVFVTLAEQGTSYDYAAVGTNTSVGTFGKTAGLPNGDYTHIRVTLSDAMVLTASGTDKSAACRTSSSGSTGNVSDQLTDAAIGSNDGGTATQQALTFPNGSTATGALTTAGLTEVGSTLQIIKPASFSITDESNPPNIAINVDVEDSVEVLTSSGNCHVLPQPPKLTVVVTAG